MPIYVKQEMSDAVGVGSHKKKAYYRLKTFSNFSTDQLVEFISRNEHVPESQVYAVLVGLRHQMARIMGTGHTVTIDGLGTFKLKVSGKSQKEKKDVTSAGAKISVVFEPAAELTSRLNDEREFRFVEVPTAEGEQDADDEEGPSDGGDDDGSTDSPQDGGGTTPPSGGGVDQN